MIVLGSALFIACSNNENNKLENDVKKLLTSKPFRKNGEFILLKEVPREKVLPVGFVKVQLQALPPVLEKV